MRVINITKESPAQFASDEYAYIGRNSAFANPWGCSKPMWNYTMRQAQRNFMVWLLGTYFQEFEQKRRANILNNLDYLQGKVLGCYCRPLNEDSEKVSKYCHGHVLIKFAEGKLKPEGNVTKHASGLY